MLSIDALSRGSLAIFAVAALGCAEQRDDAEPAGAGVALPPSGPLMYVTTLGADTVTAESFTRTSVEGIQGQLVERNPATRLVRYSATLGAEGRIQHLEAEETTPSQNPDGDPPRSWVVDVADGVATVTVRGGRNPGTIEVPVAEGAIPTLGRGSPAMFVWDQIIRQARESGVDEHPVELIRPGAPEPTPNTVTRVGGDTVAITFFSFPLLAWPGPDGLVGGSSGRETTFQVETRRGPAADIAVLASAFAARDARGEGLGMPSPPATVEASMGGANIGISYSQPAMRGRPVWGGLVPYGEVWRTGANAATHFTTATNLAIGDVELPAGTYTLWSTYTPDSATLIINSQTNQWGTMYDETQDFGRTGLSLSTLSTSVSRFTISVQETADGGTLHLDWDRNRYSVPIRAR